MHSPSARALRHLDCYYIILVRTLKHLIPAKCAINITYTCIRMYTYVYTCIRMYTYVYTWSKHRYTRGKGIGNGSKSAWNPCLAYVIKMSGMYVYAGVQSALITLVHALYRVSGKVRRATVHCQRFRQVNGARWVLPCQVGW